MTALKMRRVEAGVYETQDGAYRVESGVVDQWCENPHPGCPGNEPHEQTCWVISRRNAAGVFQLEPWASPSPDTKRDAVDWLASHLAKET